MIGLEDLGSEINITADYDEGNTIYITINTTQHYKVIKLSNTFDKWISQEFNWPCAWLTGEGPAGAQTPNIVKIFLFIFPVVSLSADTFMILTQSEQCYNYQ